MGSHWPRAMIPRRSQALIRSHSAAEWSRRCFAWCVYPAMVGFNRLLRSAPVVISAPAVVVTPSAAMSMTTRRNVSPANNRSAARRRWRASASTMLPRWSYPNRRLPVPRHRPAALACRVAAAIRSPLWADSCSATAPRIWAVMRPEAEDRSHAPAVTVTVSTPAAWVTSTYSTRSFKRRVRRSGCQASTTSTRPPRMAASMAVYSGRSLPEYALTELST